MAMYYCGACGQLKDDDWCVGSEHPTKELELVCENCITELEEEINGEGDE